MQIYLLEHYSSVGHSGFLEHVLETLLTKRPFRYLKWIGDELSAFFHNMLLI